MKKYCFGADIGGTTVKLGLFDQDGIVLDKWEIPTRTENEGIAILPDMAASIKEKIKEHGLLFGEPYGFEMLFCSCGHGACALSDERIKRLMCEVCLGKMRTDRLEYPHVVERHGAPVCKTQAFCMEQRLAYIDAKLAGDVCLSLLAAEGERAGGGTQSGGDHALREVERGPAMCRRRRCHKGAAAAPPHHTALFDEVGKATTYGGTGEMQLLCEFGLGG